MIKMRRRIKWIILKTMMINLLNNSLKMVVTTRTMRIFQGIISKTVPLKTIMINSLNNSWMEIMRMRIQWVSYKTILLKTMMINLLNNSSNVAVMIKMRRRIK